MMAYVPALNTAEVVVGTTVDGLTIDNVHNFEFPGTLTTSILDDLALSVITSWIANMAAALSEEVILNFVKATDLTSDSAPTVTRFPPPATNGDVPSDTPPTNAAVVVTETTDGRGRSFRGRSYTGGFPRVEMADAGHITTGYQTDLATSFAVYMADIEDDNGCDHVVVSRRHNNADRANAVMTPITGYAVELSIDSQRRRLAGRGI